MLVHPQPHALTCITMDASNLAVKAVLEQFINGQWKPISFFGKKLSPSELKYSALDRELLEAHLAVRHFQYFVEAMFSISTLTTSLLPLCFTPVLNGSGHDRPSIWLLFPSS